MSNAFLPEHQRLRDSARKAHIAYDAFSQTAPLPSEGITEAQLSSLVRRLKQELDAAEAALAAFENAHPISG